MFTEKQIPVTIFDKFNLTDEQFAKIQVTYALLEPLTCEYLTQEQKNMMRLDVCQKLGIAERTFNSKSIKKY